VSAYADTSVFIALYLPDRHANGVAKLLAEFHPRFFFTPLHRAELSHAVYAHVSSNKISADEARQVIAHFERDCANGRWREVAIPDTAMTSSMSLAKKHPKTGASSADSLHVASALELRSGNFWTLEPKCAALASAVGLTVYSARDDA